MNSAIVTPSTEPRTLALSSGEKQARLSKKEFFATLPTSLKRSQKEERFAEYASELSAQYAGSVSGALAAGLIRLRSVKLNASGKCGTIGYEMVQDKAPRASVTEKLRNEIADLKAQLAAAQSAQVREPVLA